MADRIIQVVWQIVNCNIEITDVWDCQNYKDRVWNCKNRKFMFFLQKTVKLVNFFAIKPKKYITWIRTQNFQRKLPSICFSSSFLFPTTRRIFICLLILFFLLRIYLFIYSFQLIQKPTKFILDDIKNLIFLFMSKYWNFN